MTATEIIYRAWMNTETPLLYETANEKGERFIAKINLLDPKNHKAYDAQVTGTCCICAKEFNGGFASKDILSSSYTDWHIHRAPDSVTVCESCAFTLMLNIAEGRAGLCRYSFVAGETLKICNRADLRDAIIAPPPPPFVMVCAISQKKHLAIKARISYGRENYFCMMEEQCVSVNRQLAKDMINIIAALRGIGMTKDEIGKGVIRYDKIKGYRTDAYDKINHLLQPCRTERQFALCLHVAQKMNEEDAICYLGLTPKTTKPQQEPCLSTPYTAAETLKGARADTKCGGKSKDSPAGQQSEQMTLQGF